MALTQNKTATESSTTAAPTPPKLVTAFNENQNFQLMYTVPEGRKWVGRVGSRNQGSGFGPWITSSGETPSSSISNTLNSIRIISNAFANMGATNSNGNCSTWEITLHAGDMVHSDSHTSSHYSQILGVESDA